jgi:hypothetical protein
MKTIFGGSNFKDAFTKIELQVKHAF